MTHGPVLRLELDRQGDAPGRIMWRPRVDASVDRDRVRRIRRRDGPRIAFHDTSCA
jgi:hypothetical protein